ncbi:MAG: transcription elongation factor GreA [Bacilli bacterium]|nr:transcription elongation factor GreA [Bacilli bacterium]
MEDDNKTILTKDGEEKLKEELNRLINTERPQIIEALAAARAQGDLKENADYDAARNRQGEVEGRIKEIEHILANAKVIKEDRNNDKVVGIGSCVTIKASNERKEETYEIVGTVEADPLNNKISNESPLGMALCGHKVGDEITVRSKANYNVKILSIQKNK